MRFQLIFFREKVTKMFGKAKKVGLSLHPLSRRGRRLTPGEDRCNEVVGKKFEKMMKKIWREG